MPGPSAGSSDRVAATRWRQGGPRSRVALGPAGLTTLEARGIISHYDSEYHIIKHGAQAPQPYPGTQAVLRAVRLLKAFRSDQPELSLAQLTRIAGLNKTTAYRILTALESQGMVERGRGGEAYRLGPEVLALGSRALGSSELRVASRHEIESLAHSTRETVTLEVLLGAEVLILDEAIGGHVIGAMPSVGTRWPAHATSTGKVLLAWLPEDECEALLEARLPALTPRTITSPEALRRELARVRERGYATTSEELEPGFVALAAPIRSHEARVVAAISIGGPKSRVTAGRTAEIARQLPGVAARISARLGFRDAPFIPQSGGPRPAERREARR